MIDQLKKKYEQAGAGEAIYLGEISPESFFKACADPEKLPPLSGPVTLEDGTVIKPMTNDMGYVGPYRSLRRVLDEAFNHASAGKGLERHACDEPFEQQTICQTARAHGIGFCTGQAEKKGRESHRLLPMEGGVDRAVSELLGAINYLAAAVIVIREGR